MGTNGKGLPFVALDAPGAREVVRGRHNGRLLAEATPAAFTAAMQWVVELATEPLRELKRAAIVTGMVDEIVEPAQLLPRAIEAASTLATAAAFSAVKRQLRAPVARAIRAVLDSGSDPLLG